MTTLELIPKELYLEYFIEYFTIKELGALTMVSKTLKNIFDSQEIWKKEHFKTTPMKILDSSVYIGYYEIRRIRIKDSVTQKQRENLISELEKKILERSYDYGYRIQSINRVTSNKTNIMLRDYNILFETKYFDEPPLGYEFIEIPFEYFTPIDSILNRKHIHFNTDTSLRALNIPGTTSYIHGWSASSDIWIINQPKEVKEAYIEYLNSKGIFRSTRPEHYLTETLDFQGVKVNYKSYKRMTLKKFLTKEKKKIGPAKTKAAKAEQKIETIDHQIKMLQKKKKKLLRESDTTNFEKDKQMSLCQKLENAIS